VRTRAHPVNRPVRKTNGNGHTQVTLEVVRALMRDDLERSGLKETDLFCEPSLTDLRGQPYFGYSIFYPDPDTGRRTDFRRFRRLAAPKDIPKYDQPSQPPRAYFPGGIDWPRLRSDVNERLFETEGEKKAQAAATHGIACIGLGGVYNYKAKGKDGLIGDLEAFAWEGRERVYLIYDSDARTNAQVQKAADRLSALLLEKGATPYQVVLPQLRPGEKTGLDDFLLARGKVGFESLIAEAEPWESRRIWRHDLLHRAVAKAEGILAARPDYKMFSHGSELVRVVEQDSEPSSSGPLRRPQGNTYLAEMRAENIELLLSKSGCVFAKVPVKGEKGKTIIVDADPKFVWCKQVISNVRAFPEKLPWRPLELVANTPYLLGDGELVDEPGYHSATGVWFDPKRRKFPHIPARPTKEQARAALDKFAAVYGKFPFAGKDEQRWDESPSYAAVLATILSTMIRHLLPTVPMLAITAPEAGTGKTKIAESIALLATGCMPTRVCFDGVEEFEKLLPVALRCGDRVVLIDNVVRNVNSPKLAEILTTDAPTDFRVLGESRTVKTPNHSVFLATGNQLVITGDLPRRTLACRLIPKVEQPETRQFDFDPVNRARELFPEMAPAALTALRYYFLVGCPTPQYDSDGSQLGSFEEWNRRVRGLLVHLGFGDPLKTQKEVRADDPRKQNDIALAEELHKNFRPDEKFSAALIKAMKGSEAYVLLCQQDGTWNEVKAGIRLSRLRDRVLGGLSVKGGEHLHGKAQYTLTCMRAKGECETCNSRKPAKF
jgi:Domain of unknown function (DUF3854)